MVSSTGLAVFVDLFFQALAIIQIQMMMVMSVAINVIINMSYPQGLAQCLGVLHDP